MELGSTLDYPAVPLRAAQFLFDGEYLHFSALSEWHSICYVDLLYAEETKVKTTLILIYIVLVLMASGLAGAAEIKSVEFDPSLYLLRVSGTTSGCETSPQLLLRAVDAQVPTYVINVSVKKPQLCAQVMVPRDFDFVQDVRNLLDVRNEPAEIVARLSSGRELQRISIFVPDNSAQSFEVNFRTQGFLVKLAHVGAAGAEYALVQPDGGSVLVRSIIDLDKYVGSWTNLKGYVLDQVAGPALPEINDELGFEKETDRRTLSLVFATEISSVPLQTNGSEINR